MKKKRLLKITISLIFGILVTIILSGLVFAAPSWNNGVYYNDSYYIVIDANDDASDQAFGVFTDGLPGSGMQEELFRIEENGRVGIGTSNPTAKLVVYGTTDESFIYFQDSITGDNTNTVGFCVGLDTNQNGKIWNYENEDINFGTNDQDRMIITNDGKIGIGTTSPNNLLDIEKGGTAKSNLDIFHITNTVNGADMDNTKTSILFNQYYYDASSPAEIEAGRISVGTESDWTSTTSTQDGYMVFSIVKDGTINDALRINSDRCIGIGITNPSEKLEIDGAIKIASALGTSAGTIQWTGSDFEGYDGSNWLSFTDVGIEGSGNPNQIAKFSASNTITSSIIYESSYNIGIDTSEPGAKLDVNGNIYAEETTGKVRIGFQSGGGLVSAGPLYFYADSDDTGDYSYYWHDDEDVEIMQLYLGKLGIGEDNVPDALLDIEEDGTAKSNFDIFHITNSINAIDMDNTRTNILFSQYYYDASTPDEANIGKIAVGTETDWTSTTSTQDGYMAFSVVEDGSLNERIRIKSTGNIVFKWATGVEAMLGRGETDTDITYIALYNADGEKCYIYPNTDQDDIVVSGTKP